MASQVLGQRQALTGDPYLQLMGRPGQSFSAAGGVTGMAQGQAAGIGNRVYGMETPYMQNLFAGNQQAQLAQNLQTQQLQGQANMASMQAKQALTGGILGGIGSLAGGMLSGAGQAARGGSGRTLWSGLF